jgi:hypothetical protein
MQQKKAYLAGWCVWVAALMATTLLLSCKKKETPLPVAATPSAVVQDDPDLVCVDLPPTPAAGWRDTSALADQQINAFFFNPLNPNQVIFVANGDLFGFNKMYNYDILTKKMTLLGDNGDYLPRINKKGWIVFNRVDLNIYKVKVNGDSLTQLTFNNTASDPKWDYTGNSIYFYQSAQGSQPTLLVTMNANGSIYTTFPVDLANTAVAHKPERIAYLKSDNDRVSVFLRDLAVNSETLVLSVPATVSTFQTVLSHLVFDATDENLYWSNDQGIFKYNLAAAKPELLKENCSNIVYSRPMMVGNDNLHTFTCHTKKAISPSRVLHQYKALELDLNLKQQREVKIFH